MTNTKLVYISLFLIVLSIIGIEYFNQKKTTHPDAGLNIEQMTEKWGYPLEAHQVTTEDGYILTLHRIPHGREKIDRKRIPVLFMHGFTQTSTDFVLLGPGKALGLLLAEEGYDVWLGNARGSTWSRAHTKLNPDKDSEFWDYNLHEIGTHDTPAFVNFILKTTNETQLHYVGFSQGTIAFFVMMAQKPDYASKIRLMSALAPAIFLGDPKPIALTLGVYFRKTIQTILIDILNLNEIFTLHDPFGRFLKLVCNENSLFVYLCELNISLLHGFNPAGQNKTMFSLVFSNMPAGASPKQLMHIVQLMESGNFQQFDLGVDGNLQKYNQKEPPTYVLSGATAPVALYYASNDLTVNIKNMEKIVQTLPNVVKTYQVPSDTFDHNDFVYSYHADSLLYKAIIEEIKKH